MVPRQRRHKAAGSGGLSSGSAGAACARRCSSRLITKGAASDAASGLLQKAPAGEWFIHKLYERWFDRNLPGNAMHRRHGSPLVRLISDFSSRLCFPATDARRFLSVYQRARGAEERTHPTDSGLQQGLHGGGDAGHNAGQRRLQSRGHIRAQGERVFDFNGEDLHLLRHGQTQLPAQRQCLAHAHKVRGAPGQLVQGRWRRVHGESPGGPCRSEWSPR